jgi:hypothetical protein
MMSDTQNKKVTVFLDYLGRNIVGEIAEDSPSHLKVKNPVILHVPPTPDQAGRMAVQLFPLFFREFLADKTEDVVFFFSKERIVQSSIEAIDFRLFSQYNQMFNKNNEFVSGPAPTQNDSSPSQNDVIKLFDE